MKTDQNTASSQETEEDVICEFYTQMEKFKSMLNTLDEHPTNKSLEHMREMHQEFRKLCGLTTAVFGAPVQLAQYAASKQTA